MSVAADSPKAQFLELLEKCLGEGAPVKLTLGKYRGTEPGLERLIARPVSVRGEACLSCVYRYQTRDLTKNLPLADGLATVDACLGDDFRSAHLLTDTEEVELAFSKKGKATLHRRPLAAQAATSTPAAGHDRVKPRHLELDRPYLVDLGVTDAQHRLIPAMARKWKQINHFIEVFSHAFEALKRPTDQPVHVVDFGAGKGYLTFALHDYLRNSLGYAATVTGIELRDSLVRLCMAAVERHQLDGLAFYQGDVRTYTPPALDVMIALHACDIATDYAIHTGIRLGADIILCAPCCHKQLRPQLQSPQVLQPMLQHGIHLGQQAEMLTDGLRALLLDACGYETRVFEFVALEHTSKNKMIMAVKKGGAPSAEVLTQIQAIKEFYGIREQCLETLLKGDGLL